MVAIRSWSTHRLGARRESLQPVLAELLTTLSTDILCLHELRGSPKELECICKDSAILLQSYIDQGYGWNMAMTVKPELLYQAFAGQRRSHMYI